MAKEFFTLHQLIDVLTEDLNLTPEQQFRVTAKIKRLIHIEKRDTYSRYAEYADGRRIFEEGNVVGRDKPKDTFLHRILSEARDNHDYWKSLPDEQIVTWDVGSHKFKQNLPPCKDCNVEVTTHTGWLAKGSVYYCTPCAKKNGLWEEFHKDDIEDDDD
jgi:hypothetical protein